MTRLSLFWPMVWRIARTETTLRLRRFSTLFMMLLVAIAGFYMVPDPAAEMTAISVRDHRVLYNSVAVAIGGASLATLLVSLLGFYLISNSLSRDIRSRIGAILGATPVSNTALMLGKWLGNSAYLFCIVLALIPGSLLVQWLRGEAPIQLEVYVSIYAAVFVPQVLFVAAIALWFESERWLRGRLGDVLYFIIWASLFSTVIGIEDNKVLNPWEGMADLTAMGFVIAQLMQAFGTSELSIGASSFDPALSPVVLHGIDWSLLYLRFLALIPSAAIFLFAVWRFHRFDPDRVKADAGSSHWGVWRRLNRRLQFLRGLLRPGWALLPLLPRSLARIWADVLLTLSATPVWLLLLLVGWLLALVLPAEDVANSVMLTLTFGALVCADLGIRDRQSGMWAVIAATPRISETFLRWKLASAFTTMLLFVAVSLTRLLLLAPVQAGTLLIGAMFCAAAALGLAVITQGSKVFAGGYLLLLYVALNARAEPMFDFAGFNGVATPATWSGYAVAALLLLLLSGLVRRLQLR